jgi:hypothetical protein
MENSMSSSNSRQMSAAASDVSTPTATETRQLRRIHGGDAPSLRGSVALQASRHALLFTARIRDNWRATLVGVLVGLVIVMMLLMKWLLEFQVEAAAQRHAQQKVDRAAMARCLEHASQRAINVCMNEMRIHRGQVD